MKRNWNIEEVIQSTILDRHKNNHIYEKEKKFLFPKIKIEKLKTNILPSIFIEIRKIFNEKENETINEGKEEEGETNIDKDNSGK